MTDFSTYRIGRDDINRMAFVPIRVQKIASYDFMIKVFEYCIMKEKNIKAEILEFTRDFETDLYIVKYRNKLDIQAKCKADFEALKRMDGRYKTFVNFVRKLIGRILCK